MRSGRPESVPTASEAAAGARVCSVSALHGTAGAADGLYGMLGSPGIPGGNERRRRSSGTRSSPAMPDGGFGCSWGGGYRAQSKGERGRGGVGAHSGAVGMVSRLGGAPEWPNRRRRSSAAGEGKTSGVAFRGSSGRVTRRGGRGRTGGASWGVGEARGGRWPWVRRRWRRAPLGGVRERETEEGMGSRGREGRCRGRGRLRGVARESGRLPRRSRRWPALFGRAPRLASARPPGRGGRGQRRRRWAGPSWAGPGGLHG